jgi:SAM-dependent methyltransferase
VRWIAVIVVFVLAAGIAAAVCAWLRERWRREAFPAANAPALLNPARRLIQSPQKVVRAFGLKPGDVVLELGPGPGYFTTEAVDAIGPSGRVICMDLQKEMLVALREHVSRETHVDLVVADAMRLPIRRCVLDAAYLVSMLGEVPDQAAAVGELTRVLRRGGVVSFCETVNDPDYVRLSVLRRMCWDAGLQATDWRRQLLGYIARFTKPQPRS